MGKFRSKLKGKSKGKRWPKGQSSNSNPETRKHRDQAKSRFFQENLGPSNLTLDAIRAHDATQLDTAHIQTRNEEPMDSESSTTFTYNTGDSFASEWSQCTNMTFNRFLKVFRADSALHKHMLAVLAAVAEVIKENGGTETPTEYFCALIMALEQVLENENVDEDHLTAILSLLSMGIKSVPTAVLKTSFGTLSQSILNILKQFVQRDNNVIIKSSLNILAALLRIQEPTAWTDSRVTDTFTTILNPFCLHNKPKWRKCAQAAAKTVIVKNEYAAQLAQQKLSPAADQVAEFCDRVLDTCMGGTAGDIVVSSIKSSQTTILHVLALIKDLICFFSKSQMKKSCETMLRLMTFKYPLVTSCALQVLHSLFANAHARPSAKLNAQLISALYDYQPELNDLQPTQAWLVVMQQAHLGLATADLHMAANCLPKIVASLVDLWLSEKTEIITAVTYTLETLLNDGLALMVATAALVDQYKHQINECLNAINAGLGYQYNKAWHHVLHVVKVMFEVGGATCTDLLICTLKSLAELRDSYKFIYNTEVEYAVGAAVRSMGPDVILRYIPLQRDNGEINLERSWLLPILKENTKASTLRFWAGSILPLAVYCQQRATELAASNDGIGAHSYELLSIQLWNLLPSFCNAPTDIQASFKDIAKTLGMAISKKKDLRLAVMASLRKLVAHAQETNCAGDLEELARFDKNYLPILFNLYTSKPVGTDEEGQRLAALETIKLYLTVSRPELRHELFANARERLKSVEDVERPDAFMKESILDLIRILIPYQSPEAIKELFKESIAVLPQIKDNKDQKKAYRLLEEICGSEADSCKLFLKENRKLVHKLLLKSLESASVSSKGARLRCLNYLLKSQPQLDHESLLIKNTLLEAVMCCKDINTKCRASAYVLLNTIGELLHAHNQMAQFLAMLVAGLVGTPQTISNTCLALASVVHNFTGALGMENIEKLLVTVTNLMTSHTREIVGACLSFIKVYCRTVPSPIVACAIPVIMKGLLEMTDDCQRHFRLKVRDILARFVRKYGAESLMAHVPNDNTVMYKRLRNLRKLYNRKKRNETKEEEEEKSDEDEFKVPTKARTVDEILADSDSDADPEDVQMEKSRKTERKAKPSAWIHEDPDDIVDFFDPTTSQKITATKPGGSQPAALKKQKKGDFKCAADGRLIIEDDDSDSDGPSKTGKLFAASSDSDEDHVSTAETMLLTDRKRKRKYAASVRSAGTVRSDASSKYKAGGSGIHRPVAQAGAEFKAKKAKGDVKKGGVDPYAYLALKRSTLNKRKKLKMAGQFKHVVKAAKKGAKKGLKARKKVVKQ